VLAIEQNWRMRKLIRANLEAVGLRVHEAISEQHGLQQIREQRPDLILLDLDLPEKEALRLLHNLHIQLAEQPVPIVAMSADPPSRELRSRGQLAGHLLKPFTVLALLDQVLNALDSSPAVD
jgi:CheY-like chemotaxis protein